MKFAVRLSLGYVTEVFNVMRDKVLLPFPCVQTDVPIYGGNSGGPLFDNKGRVCAVHCTSYQGADVAFHVPIRGVLQLGVSAESLNISADKRKDILIAEMAWMRLVSVEPPLLNLNSPLQSILRWLSYVFRQFARGRLPSFNFHIFPMRV
ncbi:trypsin-like peptidase domain-containing protein [Polaromonas sp.]|uniref:trypsin-like peptidase domain-containing protein n=1 Tax=Polaromonas sp. TaxID=1869339 RepID=UPI00345DB7AD